MTASPAPRTALQLVPEPDDTEWLTAQASAIGDPAAAESESWEATAVLNQWAPEHQLIGAMMWLTADRARPILELVPDTAIWQPMRQWAYETIRALVADGRDPNPVVVLAAARQRSWSQSAGADQPPTAVRHHRLAVYLAAAYNGTAGTDRINDWGSTAVAGQQYVVADQDGDWTAIWYSGAKVWFYNPDGGNTAPAHGVQVIKAAGTSPVAVYGSSYPDASEYPSGLSPSTQAPLKMYTVPAGQAYVATRPPAPTQDYFKSSGTVVTGAKSMYTIQYNHRVALVYATDVTADAA